MHNQIAVKPDIYVVAHKESRFPADTGYKPIHAGRIRSSRDLGIIGDDTGQHISEKNPYFCEMTALYWIWKNTDSDWIGFVHYRRFFCRRSTASLVGLTEIAASCDFVEFNIGADLIVGQPIELLYSGTKYPQSVREQYCECHHHADLFSARSVIRRRFPEYIDAFDYLMNINKLFPYNMFIGSRAALSAYCEWIFAILFELEDIIPYQFYSSSQQRVFGFLAERLFNVWLLNNSHRFKIAYRHTVRTE